MKGFRLGSVLFLAIAFIFGCSDDEKPADPGKITVHVNRVLGQNGDLLAVSVFPYDWYPGAEDPAVGELRQEIDSDDFSYTATVDSVQAIGSPIGSDAIFAPGDYSVVFFVAPSGSAPEYYAEVRSEVDGDIEVSAPAWDSWVNLAVR